MRNDQRGMTIIEVMVVLIISIIGLSIGMGYVQKESDRSATLAAGGHAKQVGDAASAYIKDNYSTVVAGSTVTTPFSITEAMLKPQYLPASFSSTNGYGQAYTVLALQPAPNKIEAIVVTTGGSALPEVEGRRAAQNIGAAGGFISTVAPTAVTGAYGGWSITLPGSYGVNPGAGHLAIALFFQDGSLISDYLYRNPVPGRPELNQMNTPIIMASVQATGAVCATGAIARDAAGKVLSCQAGVFAEQGGSAYWKDPVPNVAGLPVCNAVALGHTRVVHTPAVGTGPRAYTCNGATWQPLAVDNAGNLTVPGQLSLGANNRILGGGAQGPYGATTIAGSKSGWTGVEYRDGAGNYQITQMTNRSNIGYHDATTGRWLNYSDTAGNLTLDQTQDYTSGRINPGWAIETYGCATGQIAKASYTVADGWAWNGKILSCVSGVWKSVAAGAGGRAWVRASCWSGGCGVQRTSGVSWVQWLGTGRYRVHFSPALPTDVYAITLGNSYFGASSTLEHSLNVTATTAGYADLAVRNHHNAAVYEAAILSVSVSY